MARPRHPNKEIEQAIAYAEGLGWTVEMSNGHAWGSALPAPLPVRLHRGGMVNAAGRIKPRKGDRSRGRPLSTCGEEDSDEDV